MIDVRQLSYFIAVVEAKSFTAAAEVLCIAQPALSQYLQRLEHTVGQRLLVRHSRGVEPTAAGVRLVEHARSILTMVETAKSDIGNFKEGPQHRVRIGMPRSLCETLAVNLMTTWTREQPNVSLYIVEKSSVALTEAVLAGRLDLAVTSYPSDNSSLIAEPLLQDQLCAVMPGQRSEAPFGEIRFVELVQQPLILYTSANVSRQLIDMAAKYCSVTLNVAYEVDSPALAVKMVEANLGSTILPYLAVRNDVHAFRAMTKHIVAPGITRRLHLIRSRHRPLTAYDLQICKAIKNGLAQQLAGDKPLLELDLVADG